MSDAPSPPNPRAITRLRALAAAGDVEAACQLGRCYLHGWAVAPDPAAAFDWFWQAAGTGHAEAAYQAAALYLVHGGATGDAAIRERLRAAATAGHADAQALFGWCLQRGRLGGVDIPRAVDWFRRSASAGSALGRYYLGLCYEFGVGTEQSLLTAVRLYEFAAAQGETRAQLNLGRALSAGRGVPRDAAAALRWFRAAAEAGYAKAQYNLGLLLAGGEAPEQDDEEAARWMQAAAEQGLAKAQYTLALLYRRGLGVEKDPEAMRHWLERAAQAGYAKAQYQLSRLLRRGRELPADPVAARHWLERAADAGLAAAQFALGRSCIAHGGAAADTRAAECFRLAALQGHADAMFSFGVCHLKGRGVAANPREAAAWFERARAAGSTAAATALQKLARLYGTGWLARPAQTGRKGS